MHELLAPIVHVIEEDAIDHASISTSDSLDNMMLELLDSSYAEHDAFLLFSKVMDYAQSFYATSETTGTSIMARSAGLTSSIVERSKFIHDICLNKIDPELSLHLTSIEILPQIFLM
jgi:TBC1 domain family member 5